MTSRNSEERRERATSQEAALFLLMVRYLRAVVVLRPWWRLSGQG
nr:MAG TPA: hypothetical protein [Caudoviricetes sp.]